MKTITHESDPADDGFTLAAIGILAVIATMFVHEAGGHGGMCIAAGGRVTVLTALDEYCTRNSPWIDVAGPAANFFSGGLSWVALRMMRSSPVNGARIHLRYFLWLTMAYNLFNAAGYLPYSVLTGFGDWAALIRRFPAAFPSKMMLALIGAVLYLVFLRALRIEMGAFVRTDEPGWRQHAWRLVLVPYFAGGIVTCVAGALSPSDQFGAKKGLIIGAYAAFGAAIGLLRIPSALARYGSTHTVIVPSVEAGDVPVASSPRITRSLGWIFSAAVVLAVFLAVVAPGLRIRQ